MKTTINKSRLMKRAWTIYRAENNSTYNRRPYEFQFALRRAWKEAKQEAESANRKPVVTHTIITDTPDYYNGMINYYGGSGRQAYYGD